MMQWIYGNLFVISIIGVIFGLFWLYGFVMWTLGMPPNEHRIMNVIAAMLSLFGGYAWFSLVVKLVSRISRYRMRP